MNRRRGAMPLVVSIKRAEELDFSWRPRCPTCDVGIFAYGNEHPFVVDDDGRVYCRRHGGTVDPSYPALLAAYRRERLARRRMDAQRRERELGPIGELLRRIEDRYRPEEVWLFGSRARGDARPTSDWDLLVVVSDATHEDDLDLKDAWRLQRGSGVHADVIPMRMSDYCALVDTPNTLAFEVAREGFVIHERK